MLYKLIYKIYNLEKRIINSSILLFLLFSANLHAQQYISTQKVGGLYSDGIIGIALDNNNNVYTTGFFKDSVDFNPGPIKDILVSKNGFDGFIKKSDPIGNFLWVKQIKSISGAIITDNSNNIYITGAFSDTVDFDPGPANYNLVSSGWTDMFILKLNEHGDFIWAKRIGGLEHTGVKAIALDAQIIFTLQAHSLILLISTLPILSLI